VDPSGNTHGFVWQQGGYTTVDFPGATATFMGKIDNLGHTVGVSDVGNFIFDAQTKSFLATTFECPGDEQFPTDTRPGGINNRGQIAGRCRTEDGGPLRGFIATPVESDG